MRAVRSGTSEERYSWVDESPCLSLWSLAGSPGGPNVQSPYRHKDVRPVTAPDQNVAGISEASMPNRTEPEYASPVSLAQAERVVQQVVGGQGPGTSLLRVLLALGGDDRVMMADLLADPEFDDRNINQNLITSLLVLTSFYGDTDQRVTDIAIDLGISTTTTLRYLRLGSRSAYSNRIEPITNTTSRVDGARSLR